MKPLRPRDYRGGVGPVTDLVTHGYALRFDVDTKRIRSARTAILGACKSDEARRLLLGIGERFADGEEPEMPTLMGWRAKLVRE